MFDAIPENCNIGQVVGLVSATDVDQDQILYSITGKYLKRKKLKNVRILGYQIVGHDKNWY